MTYGSLVLHQVPTKGIPHPPFSSNGRQSCDGDGYNSGPCLEGDQEYVTGRRSHTDPPSFFSDKVDSDLDYLGKGKFFLRLS